MTVGDLIEELKKYDVDKEVMVEHVSECCSEGGTWTHEDHEFPCRVLDMESHLVITKDDRAF